MKTSSILAFVLVAICFGVSAKIKVGVGQTIITPLNPVGKAMAGYDRGTSLSTGVHDDLHARSIVVEGDDGTASAMITIAIVNMTEPIMDSIRSGVSRNTGIPFKNILISATHTHSAPTMGSIDGEYAQFFIKRSIESAVNAWKSRVYGKIGTGSIDVIGLAFNDRRMEYGGLAPDPEAGIIKIENEAGKLLGVFFNYGCHPSTMDLHNLQFTEDWPFFSIQGIKQKVGKDVIVGYFQSAQGDAKVGYGAELSAIGAYMQGVRTFANAENKGRLMTDAVLKVLPSIKTSNSMQIRVAYDKFKIPLRTTYPYTQAEALAWQQRAQKTFDEKQKLVMAYPTDSASLEEYQEAARKLVANGQIGTTIGPRTLDKYKADLWLANQAVTQSKRIEALPKDLAPLSMPMQAIRLGNSVFVTFPCEVFTEIGLAVKKRSPLENTYVIGVAGGFYGYIATAAEYIEGGYAVNGSPYAPQAEQVIIESALTLINRVKN